MLDRLRLFAAVLLAVVAAWVVATGALAQEADDQGGPAPAPAPIERDSPRELFNRFFGALNDVDRGVVERWPDVFECLELPADATRGERETLAWDLKEALDYHGYVELDELPDARAIGDRSLWSLHTQGGAIVAARTDDGWRFTFDTLERARGISRRLAAQGRVKFERSPQRKWISERFPTLLGRALFLQHWQWLGLALLVILAWLAHKIVGFATGSVLGGFFARRGWERGRRSVAAASRPVGLLAVAFVISVCGPWLDLPRAPVDLHRWLVFVATRLFASLGMVLIAYRLADVVADRLQDAAAASDSRLDDQLVPLARKSIKLLVTVAGALFILDNLEVDIVSLLAGVGVGALAIALAAKDTVANLFGSLTVFLDRPFQVGDYIEVGGIGGTVTEVGFRSTRIRTGYNSIVSVPNAKLVDTMIDNLGVREYRRLRTTIGVTYSTPADTIAEFCEGIRKIVRETPAMRQDSFQIYLNEFGPSSLDVLVNVHIKNEGYDHELTERQRFMLAVIGLAETLGVEFAFPSQSVYVEKWRGAKPPEQSGAGRPATPFSTSEWRQDATQDSDPKE